YKGENQTCKAKGLSVNKFDNNLEEILNNYLEIISHSPRAFKYYCFLKFKKGAGLLWHNTSKRYKSHCTFFKCDQFSIDLINAYNITPLPNENF
ncbi:hypothetical protein ACFL6I_17435, partial [candidate division KSB1 bacterium]